MYYFFILIDRFYNNFKQLIINTNYDHKLRLKYFMELNFICIIILFIRLNSLLI